MLATLRWEREKQLGSKVISQWRGHVKKARKHRDQVSNGEAASQNDTGKRRTLISLLAQKKSADADVKSTLFHGVSKCSLNTEASEKRFNVPHNEEEKKRKEWRRSWRRRWLYSFLANLCRQQWTMTSVQVDRCSMIMFPLSFLFFNVVYWLIYFSKMDRPL